MKGQPVNNKRSRIMLDLMASKSLYNGLGQLSLHLSNALVTDFTNEFAFVGLAPRASHQYFNPQLAMRTMSKIVRQILPERLSCFFAWGRRYDLWHVTNQNSIYFPFDHATPVILTIHDLNFLRDSNDQSYIDKKLQVLQKRINRACVITTGSRFAKSEIEQYLQLGEKPIIVIYHGSLDLKCRQIKPALQLLSSDTKPAFFFSIGEFLPKKNFMVLLHLLVKMPGEYLILAGQHETPYGCDVKAKVAELGLTDRVIFLGKISNEEKKWLYDHAKAFFFPSINEGFGLPVIEGLSSGLPVFCSNATSLPEIGGGYTFEWTDFDADHMVEVVKNGLKTFAENEDFRRQAQCYGQSFTWAKAAQQYVVLYREILAQQDLSSSHC